MSQHPVDPRHSVSTAELRAVLEPAFTRHRRIRSSIARIKRRVSDYHSSFALEELEVQFHDGKELRVIFKNVNPEALIEYARQTRPHFAYDPAREVKVYRDILTKHQLGTAECFGVVLDSARRRYWIFLEHVKGEELYKIGEFEIWLYVSRWLARMHTCLGGEVAGLSEESHLLVHTDEYYWTWMQRARAYLTRDDHSQTEETRRSVRWLSQRYDRVVSQLLALPKTLIHGEFFASNVLVHRESEPLRVCPVDWETAAIGPGLIDLAALTGGRWSEDRKSAMAVAYYDTLKTGGDSVPAKDEFFRALKACRVHLAVQLLGWSPEWYPPPEHGYDWLQEAMQNARELVV